MLKRVREKFHLPAAQTFSILALLLIAMFTMFSCKTDTQITNAGVLGGSGTPTTVPSDTTTISGTVVINISGIPVDSAYVMLVGGTTSLATTTDAQGKFSFTFSLASSTNFIIYTSKSGFVLDTMAVPFPIYSGKQYALPTPIRLNYPSSGSGSQGPSGNPISIALVSQTATSIGVKSTGSLETAGLTFEALDSAGVPIDLNHSVKVNFFIEAQPNGGEFLSPSYVYTNDKGQATVNLTSGTKAGDVQIRAEINLPTGVIFSHPIAIAIFGGLPDLNHFSVSPTLVNLPDPLGSDQFQVYPSFIKIFVGDKYANPVRPQTSVYLTTTGGYIQGSVLTDQMGTALADFVVANPYPSDPILGPGFATITASTADENKQTISRSEIIYFSGDALISNVSPTTFDIPNGGSQDFDYTVSDQYNNPLTSGTAITVSVDGKDVASQGDINVSLPDTQDRRWTHFHFTVLDAADTVVANNKVTITIKSNGRNGQASTQIKGVVH